MGCPNKPVLRKWSGLLKLQHFLLIAGLPLYSKQCVPHIFEIFSYLHCQPSAVLQADPSQSATVLHSDSHVLPKIYTNIFLQ